MIKITRPGPHDYCFHPTTDGDNVCCHCIEPMDSANAFLDSLKHYADTEEGVIERIRLIQPRMLPDDFALMLSHFSAIMTGRFALAISSELDARAELLGEWENRDRSDGILEMVLAAKTVGRS